ncbi:MAG: toxin-antitoxin system YwqK family antitoxin [Janthinobacterium lividum]
MKLPVLLFLLLPLAAQAQRARRVVVYFDSTHFHPHEIFQAIVTRDTVMQGPYKRFYPNGRLEAQTRYADGKRDSAYVEFHANGKRRLEATYQAGIRQGPFKTYYDGGRVAQEGSFADDEPNGLLTTYFPTGEIKLQTTLTKGQPTGTTKELYANGHTASEQEYANGQANGAARFYYPSGKLQSEGVMRGGLLSGSYKTYYESGQLESETVINDKNGRGSYRSYYETGQLETEGTYAPSTVRERTVRNPLGDNITKRTNPRTGTAALDGLATSYYRSGKLRGKTTYRLGVPSGHATEYFENGQPKEETDYANQGRDRKVVRYYDAPGQPHQAEEQYKNDKPFGPWRELYPDGKTRQTETYALSGKLLGERLTYFDNGKVQTRQTYDPNGLLTGISQEYFASGQLRKEVNYLKGIFTGPFQERHEDGTPAVLGQYNKAGKQTGEWMYYKADGRTIDHKVPYRDGRPVTPGSGGTRPRLNGKPYVAPKKK